MYTFLGLSHKDEKVKYSEFGGQQGYDLGYFYLRAHKINDLRGNGVVYYKFEETTGNAGKYYRLNKDHKVISRGFFEYKKNKKAFELTEDNQKFLWKVSMSSEIVDIKSKVYDYKGYRRYQFVEASANTQNKIYSSIKDFEDGKYMKVEEKQNDTITVSLKSALDIDKKEKKVEIVMKANIDETRLDIEIKKNSKVFDSKSSEKSKLAMIFFSRTVAAQRQYDEKVAKVEKKTKSIDINEEETDTGISSSTTETNVTETGGSKLKSCLLYTSPSPRDS